MNWKEMLFNIAWYAVLFFLFFMLFHLNCATILSFSSGMDLAVL